MKATLRTITISETVFEDIIRKKNELDAVLESVELMNRRDVREAISKSKEDIQAGRTHKLRALLR